MAASFGIGRDAIDARLHVQSGGVGESPGGFAHNFAHIRSARASSLGLLRRCCGRPYAARQGAHVAIVVVGKGNTRKPDKSSSPEPEGFHAPFRELARAVAKKRKAAIVEQPVHSPPPAPPPERIELTEEEAFAEAFRGVAPLKAPAMALRRESAPDLSAIAAKTEADELAQAMGFDLSFHDQYVRGRAGGVSRETLAQLEKGQFAVSAHLDLHGLVLEEARAEVDRFLREQQRRGHRCVLLVTGKGKNSPRQQGVLREKVPEWLARGPSARRILAFVTARACDGGLGALYVLMRRGSSRKNRIDVELGGVGGLES